MRKIVAGLFISLDGVTEAPDTWHFPYFDDQMGAVVGALSEQADTMLLGRKTFEEFAGFWPTACDEVEMATHMNEIPKLVVSTTLANADQWQNSTLVEGDPLKTLTALKDGPGKDINVVGSSTLVRSLLRAKVLDELHLLVHPIAVGHGARLFDEGETVPLELVSATTFATGVLHTVYRPA
ncbi:bifunctional deaminase-reductase domain protein [Kribbella flavida DSM 17836]|uniref:Bifunctional deaminase-reductase domain protein n=1 Tax=Kribbella flavida (strain DSM 17836 / JCM 10339 / NBRC 14399) TaxID=479435 RepID=D2PZ42_KRIFD|nr:dihydrofolate reductase family protein [Kribbella flavida]ADB31836.1 bifunctional deaminase-reductase domain protein [Kribbella flavida DSM 17836]